MSCLNPDPPGPGFTPPQPSSNVVVLSLGSGVSPIKASYQVVVDRSLRACQVKVLAILRATARDRPHVQRCLIKLKIKIETLVLPVLGGFPAKLGPGTRSNGSGSTNGVEHT